jgi:uroporphyrin-III C-methyltransferase/precorrin-2 dehydrogenase/sirohydrochlorin ferrochelatase
MYPVMLNLKNRSCLVVGAGGVALRKVEGLLQEGASVTVVGPEPVAAMLALAEKGQIKLDQRPYRRGEIAGFNLGFGATNDPEVNQLVYEDAVAANIWVNVADEPERCSFHLPARVRRGALQIVFASGGGAPYAVHRLRRLFERLFGPEWSEWIDSATRFRQAVKSRHLSYEEESECYDRFFTATVDEDRIVVRVPSAEEELSWMRRDGSDKDQPAEVASRVTHAGAGLRTGFVSLVGAGPGDAGLLTIRGRQRLLGADTVVYDHLAETVLPCDLPASVELHPVGKKAGYHPVPQSEIISLLKRLASQGQKVVRLKGGDPYVFGRGGEEAEALAQAGIPFEVVPCVTAGVAAPAYAGIPVTQRREAVRVTLFTAHETSKEEGEQIRWDLLAPDRGATLVGYMGVTSLPQVVERLIDSGMDRLTPAAMIERGTTSRQRVVRSFVAELPALARQEGIQPPAVFVIGPAVGRSEQLNWFASRPLFGQRLVIIAPAGHLGELLELAGAELVELPLPVTPAARVVLDALPLSGCIFRSADEVDAVEEERDRKTWCNEMVAWCLGRDAEERARRRGWKHLVAVEEGSEPADLIETMRMRNGRT